MGTGWRRAFCSSIPRDRENVIAEKHLSSSNTSPSPSPRSCSKLGGFLSGGSNPSTPRLPSQTVSSPSLRCRTTAATAPTPSVHDSPRLQCKTTVTTAAAATSKSPRFLQGSNQSSPRSPLGFSLLKASLRLSKSRCGVCLQSVKTGQGTAIFTAECSHAFHFPCIAAHVRKNGTLVCPVCNTSWREVPLLAIHKNGPPPPLSHSIEETEPNHKEEKRGERVASSLRDINTKQDQKSKPSDPRAYDDDEPLLSPTAGARFIPIPEADEDGEDVPEDEIEEFQGFFPSSSIKTTSNEATTNGRDARTVEVRLLPEAAVVSVGRSHETYVVALKLKAPPPPARTSTTAPLLDPSRRAPIDLVTVLDVSGSMTGAKLQMLKRSMRLVLSSLGSADRLSIVAFSASSKRLLPLRRMTAQGQRSARLIIDRLVCGQGTSVGEALRKATKVLEDRRERNPVASIMLLSDSQDEQVSSKVANRRCPSSHVSSTRFAHLEIPVHTFGFGENGGQDHKSHEPSQDDFAKCVGGLLSVVVQDLRLQIGFSSGSAPAEITAVYSCGGKPTLMGSGKVRMGDLYAEEERELLVEMRVPAAAIGAHHVMSVRCSYKNPASQSQEVMYEREQSLLVPRPHAIRSSAPKIERLRDQFVTTKAVAEAKRLVEQNELSSAYQLLASARALLMQSSSISADEYVRWLEAEMVELQRRRQQQDHNQIQRRRTEREMPATAYLDENGEPLTPTSAWRAAERLAKVAIMRKSLNRVSDLHGFENARF
ncbi:E3 ubiquitin-protein ligase WAV3-like [Telopea speciosissima]|uniref:E3 ubiquitin-protein ligase WAV3-like n=1 Tax=Telopea speciosissima TaxID=54955 RepID=UPI001CC795D8|nr:E3 ubiquitin-protein ligase WAV3-like [Telopea speciosissima]XP_043713886.1 E3 ubiquitin-protein ligase WAV3-like [Telopea speciosissima]